MGKGLPEKAALRITSCRRLAQYIGFGNGTISTVGAIAKTSKMIGAKLECHPVVRTIQHRDYPIN